MSEAQYQNIVRHYTSQRSYYPGKYVYRLFLKVFRLEEPEPDQLRMDPATPTEEAELFVNALTHAGRTVFGGHPCSIRYAVAPVSVGAAASSQASASAFGRH